MKINVHQCENCCTLEMRAVLPGTRVPAVSMTARRPLTGSRWHGCCRINEVTATTTWTRLHLQGRASPLLTGCFYGNYLLQTRLVGISCKFLPSYKRNRTSRSAFNSEKSVFFTVLKLILIFLLAIIIMHTLWFPSDHIKA